MVPSRTGEEGEKKKGRDRGREGENEGANPEMAVSRFLQM